MKRRAKPLGGVNLIRKVAQRDRASVTVLCLFIRCAAGRSRDCGSHLRRERVIDFLSSLGDEIGNRCRAARCAGTDDGLNWI